MSSFCSNVILFRAPSQYKGPLSWYRDSHYKDETVIRPSYLYDGNLYSGKTVPLYWNGPMPLSILIIIPYQCVNSLWPSDAIWCPTSWSALVQVMALNRCLDQSWQNFKWTLYDAIWIKKTAFMWINNVNKMSSVKWWPFCFKAKYGSL